MKRQLLAGMTALTLLLTPGCSSMLNRDFVDVTAHTTASPTTEGDPFTLRAESYQELVNALIYFINQGVETGTVRLYMDSESVEDDLEKACLEVSHEDALGAYAVEYIKYSVTPVVTYEQADVQITYRRTKEQISSIVSVTGTTAIRSELKSALASFAPEQVLRISYFDGDADYILELVREAYYATPAAALGMPQAEIHIYPDSGRQRIVEILLTYPLDAAELEQRQNLLEQKAQSLTHPLSSLEGDAAFLAAAKTVVNTNGRPSSGGSTAYDALLTGGADSEGLALAMALLCQTMDLSCQVVTGTLDGQPHFWNVVESDSGWRHMDLTVSSSSGQSFYTDQELSAKGYSWDTGTVPACGS